MPLLRAVANIWKLALVCAALSACDRPATLAWRWAGNGPSRSGLLAIDDGVILGNEAGAVVRLRKDGKPVWVAQVGREVVSRPAVVGDTVVAATVSGEWLGLSLDGGLERWRLGGKPKLLLPLAFDGARAFAIAEDGSVMAISGENGGTVWKRLPPRGAKPPFTAAPMAVDGRVYVALGGAGLFALNPSDGDDLWHRPGDFVGFIAEGARVYALSRDSTLWALSSSKGEVEWQRKLDVTALSGPTLARGLLWVGTSGNGVVAYDTQDGSEAHRATLPAPLTAGVEAYRELVVVPTNGREGHLIGLRPGQDEPIFDLRVDSALRTTPRVFGDTVLVQASDGRVLAFQIQRTSK